MGKYCSVFREKKMGSLQTLVCVKQVKQEKSEEWDESMPLPGDIIEGFDDNDESFVPVKAKSELSAQLGKISHLVDVILVKVRRGDNILKLPVRVVLDRNSILQKRYTITAELDERHVAVLGDLTLEQCTELQEISRKVVSLDYRGFSKRSVKYDWKMKTGTYLPDQRCTVVSSILFSPLQTEHNTEATIVRCMAWFSAAVSSGVPLVFVNIQTEQILTSEKINTTGKEIICKGKQQNNTTTLQIVQGIRLWFLPGVSEVLLEMFPEPGEARFGMDIKRTEEGFICVYSVAKGSAADRAGLRHLYEEANATRHLLVISRLEGKSIMPASASSDGLLHCCDHNEIRDTLTNAIYRMDGIHVHIMAWPSRTGAEAARTIDAAALLPPH
ncbi:uncharacterized protein LOC123200887 [Mangifera indica]|uniref:uncharacterized protein LOC123200887 n=1 Tax=Mangifera indica TaxID=29780 RepID=UPI001CFB40F5|nr:uncharacterized protein LOC123200887 [Mangifera indica]